MKLTIKDKFFEKLIQVLADILLLGNMNVRTGKSESSTIIGQYGKDVKTDSMDRHS